MKQQKILAALIAAMSLAAPGQAGERLLDDIFTDHMVLQRERPITFTGEAASGAPVEVTFAGESRQVKADKAGHWAASFPARTADGAALELAVKAGGASEALSDILIGDVWLCSGQSNMYFPVERALNPDHTLEGTHRPDLRLFTIALKNSITPQTRLPDASGWQVATAETIAGFSAVCYFMGVDIQAANDVPLGLIHSSWGGSQIEAWISAKGLKAAGKHDEALGLLTAYGKDPAAARAAYGKTWAKAWKAGAPKGAEGPWGTVDIASWQAVPEGFGDWNLYGDPALKGFTGSVWYAADVMLTAEQAKSATGLSLGGIDETDVAWVNGTAVGNSFGWGTQRNYDLKPGALHAGRNRIVVNVYNSWAAGGLTGPADAIGLTLKDGSRVPVTGWRYLRETQVKDNPAPAPWYSINGLTGLYNAMIAPLGHLPLKGAVWYQGESNTGRAGEYEGLLNSLMADWRGQFGADLPFAIVQLPAFGKLNAHPIEDGWAGVRDAERRVAAADPKVGLVVTIDAGDRFELHPPNKQEVGRRAALVVRKLVYGADVDVRMDGRSPASAHAEGRMVTLDFGAEGGALQVMGSNTPTGFEVCGDAADSCVFADTWLDGTSVQVSVPEGHAATRIRYAWGAAPIANLYEANGLPVSPFEVAVKP